MTDPTSGVTPEADNEILWHKSEDVPVVHRPYVNPEFHVAPGKPRIWKGVPTIVYTGIIVVMLTSSALLIQGNSVGDIRSRAATIFQAPTPTLIHRSPTPTPTRAP